MADKKFNGAPFGTQTARFDVTGVHPKTKVPGTFTQIPYDKYSMLDLLARNVKQAVSVTRGLSTRNQLKLQKMDSHLRNSRQSLEIAKKSVKEIWSMEGSGKCSEMAYSMRGKQKEKCATSFSKKSPAPNTIIASSMKESCKISKFSHQTQSRKTFSLNNRNVNFDTDLNNSDLGFDLDRNHQKSSDGNNSYASADDGENDTSDKDRYDSVDHDVSQADKENTYPENGEKDDNIHIQTNQDSNTFMKDTELDKQSSIKSIRNHKSRSSETFQSRRVSFEMHSPLNNPEEANTSETTVPFDEERQIPAASDHVSEVFSPEPEPLDSVYKSGKGSIGSPVTTGPQTPASASKTSSTARVASIDFIGTARSITDGRKSDSKRESLLAFRRISTKSPETTFTEAFSVHRHPSTFLKKETGEHVIEEPGETKTMSTMTSSAYLGPSNADQAYDMVEREDKEGNLYDILTRIDRLVYNSKGEPMMLKKLEYTDVNIIVPVPPNSLVDGIEAVVHVKKKVRPKPERESSEPCDEFVKRKLGPGAYNVMIGGFSQKQVEEKASGPGWARQLEVERLAALPHLLYKEQWEENKMLKKKLGPGSYDIKDFIQLGNAKPTSGRGICDYLAPRFEKTVLSSTPGPGTYGLGGVPQRALEEKDNKSPSTKGMLDAGDRKRNLPSVGSHLGPGTYNYKSCTDELVNKVTGLKGPYKLFSGDRNEPISDGYFAAPKHAALGPGRYEMGSFVDELKAPHRQSHGKFGKRAQYPEVPTERIFLFSKTHYRKMKDFPGPGAYSVKEASKPQAINSPGFLSSAKRDDKMSQKFFTRNFNPVGAGRYDIQKYEEAQDVNGHTSVFRSKTGKPSLQMSKFLQERIRSKDVKVEDRTCLCQPDRMTRSITVM